MSTVTRRVKCVTCSHEMDVPFSEWGKDVMCMECGSPVSVPALQRGGGTVSCSEDKKRCPYCGEEILRIAIKCKHCGSTLQADQKDDQLGGNTRISNGSLLSTMGVLISVIVASVAVYIFTLEPASSETKNAASPLPLPPNGGDSSAKSWEEVDRRWIRNYYSDGAITMTDRTTGVMWFYNANAFAHEPTDKQVIGCLDNLTYAGYSDWRLPERDELIRIISEIEYFKNVPERDAYYWTATPVRFSWYVIGLRTKSIRTDDWGGVIGRKIWPCRSIR